MSKPTFLSDDEPFPEQILGLIVPKSLQYSFSYRAMAMTSFVDLMARGKPSEPAGLWLDIDGISIFIRSLSVELAEAQAELAQLESELAIALSEQRIKSIEESLLFFQELREKLVAIMKESGFWDIWRDTGEAAEEEAQINKLFNRA